MGVYNDSPAVLHFYPVPSKEGRGGAGLYELHRYPVGIVDHALALVGAEARGLMDLTDVPNPAVTKFPTGTKCDWDSFSLDAKDKTVDYAGSSGGRWVAFPSGTGGEWSVKWKDRKLSFFLGSLLFGITVPSYTPLFVSGNTKHWLTRTKL